LTSVAWGWIEPGETLTKNFWLHNDGNVPLTVTLSTYGWTPLEAETYLTLSWDYANQTIDPDAKLGLTFSLTADPVIDIPLPSFNFTALITATG